jgi:hypothetical protein
VGPWPDEPALDFTSRYAGVGVPQSIGVDEAQNVWLLDGDRVGVLLAGASRAEWRSGVGGLGRFGPGTYGSSVICGGAPGRAYVGYLGDDRDAGFIYAPDGCSFPEYTDCDPRRYSAAQFAMYEWGDMDVMKLDASGVPDLLERLDRNRNRSGYLHPRGLGIHNSNDTHFDEDRAVLSCVRAVRGPAKGDLFIGTNHGVTRIHGLEYSSHVHPVWFDTSGGGMTQMAGYTFGLGIARDGDVLIANDWQIGIVTPVDPWYLWDETDPSLKEVWSSYVPQVNGQVEFDYWRGFEQTRDGRYYLASREYGLWRLEVGDARSGTQDGTKVAGLPTDRLLSLAATEDGSLFVGTEGLGLWRLREDGTLEVVTAGGIRGAVRQLIYDPSVSPAMLWVLHSGGVTALRGH